MASIPSSPVVTRRPGRRVTTGCLLLLMVPAALLAYFWYAAGHADRVNEQREEAAVASVRAQARRASDDTARALSATHSTAPDALVGVIWQHTHAPVIAYDPEHGTYAATAPFSSDHDEKGVVLGAGSVRTERCFTLTFSRKAAATTWTAKRAERDDSACRSGRVVGYDVTLARKRLATMADPVTPAEATRVLDPAQRKRPYSVKQVRRSGDADVVTVLVRESVDGAPVQQCYAFTRDRGADAAPVTAIPVATC
ncbi:hypothetical protein [Streptomyces sp. SID7909]|uniref:hypothetical protein n=1 Tax=Streptomyces sp. SID7909 TaxID=2706092 RepID=UPI0013B94AC8|nr:hypothetical protein [Streptomyces sp. SID7909]NEC08442.1 hypothetical protein [Streptomyces sp. SID7909]